MLRHTFSERAGASARDADARCYHFDAVYASYHVRLRYYADTRYAIFAADAATHVNITLRYDREIYGILRRAATPSFFLQRCSLSYASFAAA